jgi:hypothetical protein
MRALSAQEWQQLAQAANSGNRIAYWRILRSAGDRYASLALQVATDSSLAGRTANRWFLHRSAAEGKTFTNTELNRRAGPQSGNMHWLALRLTCLRIFRPRVTCERARRRLSQLGLSLRASRMLRAAQLPASCRSLLPY